MEKEKQKIIDGTLYPSERMARRWGLLKIKKGKIVKVSGGYKVIPQKEEPEEE